MNIKQIEKRINAITQQDGRRPRILVAHLESDQPDRWTTPLAASLAEFGFDVDIGPSNQAPLQAARLAIDNDVHMMCVSISRYHQSTVGRPAGRGASGRRGCRYSTGRRGRRLTAKSGGTKSCRCGFNR